MNDVLEAVGFGCVVGLAIFVGFIVGDWAGTIAGWIAAVLCFVAGALGFLKLLRKQRQKAWLDRLPPKVAEFIEDGGSEQ